MKSVWSCLLDLQWGFDIWDILINVSLKGIDVNGLSYFSSHDLSLQSSKEVVDHIQGKEEKEKFTVPHFVSQPYSVYRD